MQKHEESQQILDLVIQYYFRQDTKRSLLKDLHKTSHLLHTQSLLLLQRLNSTASKNSEINYLHICTLKINHTL